MNPWKQLAGLLDELCACYRLRLRPSQKLLDGIAAARKAAEEYERSLAEPEDELGSRPELPDYKCGVLEMSSQAASPKSRRSTNDIGNAARPEGPQKDTT